MVTRLLSVLLLFVALFQLSLSLVFAGTAYDLSDTSKFNIRYDGDTDNSIAGTYTVSADIDGNGKQDLLIAAPQRENNFNSNRGSFYLIYDSLIDDYSGSANTIDLSDTSKFNIRYDGGVQSGLLSFKSLAAADLNGNGRLDIIVGGGGSQFSNSGLLYIIYDSLIDDYTGTGNTVDMGQSANYNILYTGANNSRFGYNSLAIADMDNNGKNDIVVGAYLADNNSRSNSGSVFVIYDSLIDDYTGTGNLVNASTATNYNLRYDGAAAGDNLAYGSLKTADIDGDSKKDILIGALSDNNSRGDSGSLYVIYNTLIDDYAGTGNNINLATATNYNLRYDGAVGGDRLSYDSLNAGDLDGDGKPEIIVGADLSDNNSRADSGSLYVIYDSLIDDYTGTGNNIDLATATNYNLRYDGAVAADTFSRSNLSTADINGDSINDVVVGAANTSFNGDTSAGSLYVIYNTLIDDYAGTGNNIDVSNLDNFSLRYDGVADYDQVGIGNTLLADINSDGKIEILVDSAYAGAGDIGSLYLIYNFPHTVSTTAVSTPTTDNTPTITGTVTATNSVTNISGVQFQADSNSPTGTWTACTATDGSFNSTSEAYSCTTSSLSDGSHTVYIRAYDTNTSYTAQSGYGSTTFTVDTTAPTTFSLLSPSGYMTDNTRPVLTFRKSTGVSSYTVTLDNSKNKRYSLSGIPASGNGTAHYIYQDDSYARVEFLNENDSDSTNDEIKVYFKGLNDSELTQGDHAWDVTAYDSLNNSRVESAHFQLDHTSPTITELSLVGLQNLYPHGVYILTNLLRQPSFSGMVYDLYQGSTKINSDGTKDTFDPVSSGPKNITLTIARLSDASSPLAFEPVYIAYFTATYQLTDIKDIQNDRKYTRFYIDKPSLLGDGYYRIYFSALDHAGNNYDSPPYYLSLNYHSPFTKVTRLITRQPFTSTTPSPVFTIPTLTPTTTPSSYLPPQPVVIPARPSFWQSLCQIIQNFLKKITR